MPKVFRYQPSKKRPLIVHLGNVGESIVAEKTRRYAERFPRFEFLGVDLKYTKPAGENWRQIEGDFKTGLGRLEDNSANIISSECALGYYNQLPGKAKKALRNVWISHIKSLKPAAN